MSDTPHCTQLVKYVPLFEEQSDLRFGFADNAVDKFKLTRRQDQSLRQVGPWVLLGATADPFSQPVLWECKGLHGRGSNVQLLDEVVIKSGQQRKHCLISRLLQQTKSSWLDF